MKNLFYCAILITVALWASCKGKIAHENPDVMTQKDTIACRIDTLVALARYEEAKSLYNQYFYLFRDEEMADVILYDLYLKSGDVQRAEAFKQIILSAPNIGNFQKMAVAFLSGDEENGRIYLSVCEKDSNLQKSHGALLRHFRELSNHGEFVSVNYKIDWKLSKR